MQTKPSTRQPTQPTKPKPKPKRPPTLLERTLESCPEWLQHYFLTGTQPPAGHGVPQHDFAVLKFQEQAMEQLWDKHEAHIMALAKRQGVEPYGKIFEA